MSENLWTTQYADDNTYAKETLKTYFCDDCEKETEHCCVKGADGWDRYSYSICLVCGSRE